MNRKNKKKASALLLANANLYQDKRGQYIYVSKKKSTAYKMDEAQLKRFKTLQMRWVLDAAAFILLFFGFHLNLLLSAVLILALSAAMEFQYRNFLSRLPKSKGILKRDGAIPAQKQLSFSKSGICLRLVLYIAVALLLIADTFVNPAMLESAALKAFCYILAILAFFMSFQYVRLFRQLDN